MRTPRDELADLHRAGLLRELRKVEPGAPPLLKVDGRDLVSFSSNDYLGLSHHPAVVEASLAATRQFGAGAGASRLICGSLGVHHQLETRLATLKKTEAALTFSSGYAAAVGVLSSLLTKGDLVILDKLCHASLIDGARLSGATIRVYPHNHLAKLERLLASARERSTAASRLLVVTESVFSMEGDRAPLREIVTLVEEAGAHLLLDEAHAVGVVGPTGQGLAEELRVQDRITFQMGTLGKAAGSAGGYLASSREWIELLVNKARSLVYSTAPPPGQAAAAQAGLDLISSPAGLALRETLWDHLRVLSDALGHHPESAIVPLVTGTNESALHASRALFEAGYLVPAIRYPTVPRGTARLRITLSAAHRPAQVRGLVRELQRLGLAR